MAAHGVGVDTLARGTEIQRRYEIVEPLGQGGCATTYRAQDRLTGRSVALKLLHQGEVDVTLRSEFERLTRLYHPNLAQVLDLGHHEGRLFYTATLVDGTTLARHHGLTALHGPLRALAFLHRQGIRHGDFKPDNILVDRKGQGVLIDLGCARPFGSPLGRSVSGTPGFLPPEVLRSQAADARADLFAVGVTLKLLVDDPPPALSGLIHSLTAKSAEARPTDVATILEALGDRMPLLEAKTGRASRLVGRAAELQVFGEVLDALFCAEHFDAEHQPPRVLCVVGEPGAGKSRLLREMVWQAQLSANALGSNAQVTSPVHALLSAARGEPLKRGTEALAASIERLAAEAPLVLALDDIDSLPAPDREAFVQVIRTVPARGQLALLTAAVSTPPEFEDLRHVRCLPLGPLSANDISAWAGSSIPEPLLPDVLTATAGQPGAIARLLEDAAGEVERRHLRRLGHLRRRGEPREGIERLPTPLRRPLGLLAACEGPMPLPMAAGLGLHPEALAELCALGLARLLAEGFVIARPAQRRSVLAGFDDAGQSLHRELAEWTGEPATRCRHLALGGATEAAASLFCTLRGQAKAEPGRFVEAAEAIAEHAAPRAQLAAAEVLLDAGEPQRALSIVAKVFRKRVHEVACRHLAARAYLRLGQERRARHHLNRGLEAPDVGPEERIYMVDTLARALRQSGQFQRSLSLAQAELSRAEHHTEGERLLHEDVGIAAVFVNELALARFHLERAKPERPGSDPRAFVRVASYESIVALRSGDPGRATERAEEALAVADKHGFSDQISHACSNLGSAQYQCGQWGGAIDSYARGLRLAIALGKRDSELALRFNLANLYVEVGLFPRAKAAAQDVRQRAERADMPYFVALADRLGAEVALFEGDLAAMSAHLRRAEARLVRVSATREIAELRLLEAEGRLGAGDFDEAKQQLAGLRAEALQAEDFRLKRELLEGQLSLLEGDAQAALERFMRVEARAQDWAQPSLRAESAQATAHAHAALGAHGPQQEAARRAEATWARIAASLPASMRTAFFAHPRRQPRPAARPQTHPGQARIYRLQTRAPAHAQTSPAGAEGSAPTPPPARPASIGSRTDAQRGASVDDIPPGARPTEGVRAITAERPLEHPSQRPTGRRPTEDSALLGASAPMQHLRRELLRLAQSGGDVVLLGEVGSGRGRVARALVAAGPRAQKPFVEVHCATLRPTELEAEIFGPPTGRRRAHAHRLIRQPPALERARGGTLFLDDAKALGPELRKRLVGALPSAKARVIAGDAPPVAGGHWLGAEVLTIPPLRDRKEDLSEIVQVILERLASTSGKSTPKLGEDVMPHLEGYAWPGNVRELEQVVARAYALAAHKALTSHDFRYASTHRAT